MILEVGRVLIEGLFVRLFRKESFGMKVYKTVEGPRELVMEKGGSISNTMKLFDDLINNEAKQGWSYHSMNTLPIYEKPGCIGGIFGNPGTVHNRYLLIFERDE